MSIVPMTFPCTCTIFVLKSSTRKVMFDTSLSYTCLVSFFASLVLLLLTNRIIINLDWLSLYVSYYHAA